MQDAIHNAHEQLSSREVVFRFDSVMCVQRGRSVKRRQDRQALGRRLPSRVDYYGVSFSGCGGLQTRVYHQSEP